MREDGRYLSFKLSNVLVNVSFLMDNIFYFLSFCSHPPRDQIK